MDSLVSHSSLVCRSTFVRMHTVNILKDTQSITVIVRTMEQFVFYNAEMRQKLTGNDPN